MPAIQDKLDKIFTFLAVQYPTQESAEQNTVAHATQAAIALNIKKAMDALKADLERFQKDITSAEATIAGAMTLYPEKVDSLQERGEKLTQYAHQVLDQVYLALIDLNHKLVLPESLRVLPKPTSNNLKYIGRLIGLPFLGILLAPLLSLGAVFFGVHEGTMILTGLSITFLVTGIIVNPYLLLFFAGLAGIGFLIGAVISIRNAITTTTDEAGNFYCASHTDNDFFTSCTMGYESIDPVSGTLIEGVTQQMAKYPAAFLGAIATLKTSYPVPGAEASQKQAAAEAPTAQQPAPSQPAATAGALFAAPTAAAAAELPTNPTP